MSIAIKMLINQLLNCNTAGCAKPIVDQLVVDLCRITDLDLHPELFLDTGASITAHGKAVSTTTAAQCAEDIERTRVFIQGVYHVIMDKLTQKNQQAPVEILYAGTGPFGLLLIPLLPLFNPALVKVTLLDIHQESLDKLQKVIEYLQLQDFISQTHCVDACQWQTTQVLDVIISETMKHGLVQEPQVSVFAQLQHFLADDGVLIPEQIRLDIWLSKAGKLPSSSNFKEIFLGKVFQLDRATASQIANKDFSCLEGNLMVPDYPQDLCDLKLTTFIQVYQQHQLTENQSQLTTPIYEKNARPIPHAKLSFHYDIGKHPKWRFNYQQLPELSDLSLPESLDANAQGIYHLKRLWYKAQRQKNSHPKNDNLPQQEWLLDRMVLDKLGTGLEPAMTWLFQTNDFSQFESWLLTVNDGHISEKVIDDVNKIVLEFVQGNSTATYHIENNSALTAEQLEFWDINGYLIIPGVLNTQEIKAARDAIWDFLGMREDDSNSWYANATSMKKIMVQMFSHPALDVARNRDKIIAVFKQLWARDDLMMTIDRVSFNPPETDNWYFPGPYLHWDVELKAPVPFGTQGLIYLTDTAENQGAFSCVPGFHKRIDQWLENLPRYIDPAQQDWSNWPVKPIAANAGDLIIWHQALPHGSSPNRAHSPRIVQYINMYGN